MKETTLQNDTFAIIPLSSCGKSFELGWILLFDIFSVILESHQTFAKRRGNLRHFRIFIVW